MSYLIYSKALHSRKDFLVLRPDLPLKLSVLHHPVLLLDVSGLYAYAPVLPLAGSKAAGGSPGRARAFAQEPVLP